MKEYEKLMRKMPERVLRAYETFQVTKNLKKTAEIIGVHRNTVGKWRKKYHWDEIEELRTKELVDGDKDLIAALREQQMTIIKTLLDRAARDVEIGAVKIEDVNDLIKALKYQRELAGDKVDEMDVTVMFALADLHQTINERRRKLLYNEDGGKKESNAQ